MNKRCVLIVASLMVGISVLACGSLGGGGAPEPSQTVPPAGTPVGPGPAETPAAPGPGSSERRCGDGVCDGPENAETCPQDCAGATALPGEVTPVPATGAPDYEPPINVALILHIDPLGGQESETFRPDQDMYVRTRDEIDWLAEDAARRGLHFTALYNGWYPQWALREGDTSQFRALLDAGHEIGSHAHRITYDASTDTWIKCVHELDRYGRPHYDAALAHQCWEDAYHYVDAVLGEIGATDQNRTMCAIPFMCSDEGQLMSAFGFTIAAGNRSEKGTSYFGHTVWNPWRPAGDDEPGHELEEDLNAGYIAVDHLAQIGSAEAHGMDLSVPQLQRRFLMLYAEWLTRERTGAEDRVWVFGFVYHPNYGDRYNAELAEFLDWLDEHFIGQTSPHGHTIARYATVGEIAQEFTAWEAAHPGTSSFSYVRDGPYPYTYAVVPAMLENAAYEAHVDLGEGVTCFRFSRDGHPIFMLWSDLGERTVDFSRELSGQVRVTDATGEESTLDAAALPLSGKPLFVEPLE